MRGKRKVWTNSWLDCKPPLPSSLLFPDFRLKPLFLPPIVSFVLDFLRLCLPFLVEKIFPFFNFDVVNWRDFWRWGRTRFCAFLYFCRDSGYSDRTNLMAPDLEENNWSQNVEFRWHHILIHGNMSTFFIDSSWKLY